MTAPSTPFVSVVVPCLNEERYIAACLDSILASTYPHDRLEVLVVDGMSGDRTRPLVAEYAERHPAVRLIDNPKHITPAALNVGIRAARGDVIVRMDAHVVYPPDYIPRSVAALEQTGADNVGPVIVTRPADTTAIARAIAVALSHPFGVGNSRFRIGSRERRWVDTVAFGCFHIGIFDRVGMFDEELPRNQDDEFNFRLAKHGGRVLLEPGVVAYYYARGSVRQVARMWYQYGYFKPLVAKKVGRVMNVRQLVPACFLVALAGTAALSPWLTVARVAFGAMVGAYAALALGCGLGVARKQGLACALALPLTFLMIHTSYGFGFLRGVAHHVLGLGKRPDHTSLALSR